MDIWIQEAKFDSPCGTCGGIITAGAPITPKDEPLWKAGGAFDAVHISCRLHRPARRRVAGIVGKVISVDPVLGPQHRFETPFSASFGIGGQSDLATIKTTFEEAIRAALVNALGE